MLYLYSGTDRGKTRAAMDAAIKKVSKKNTRTVRVSDAHGIADLSSALAGAGMFDTSRIVVLDGVAANDEMRTLVLENLPAMRASSESFFMLEGKLDADTRKRIEKYAETSERYDAAAKKKETTIFALADALKRADKKALWVLYQRELAADAAPEAIHGVLFWGAKQMFLSAKKDPERRRGARLVALLAELPHESRRRGEELEYALERFVLSGV